jgi:hypothetical protein
VVPEYSRMVRFSHSSRGPDVQGYSIIEYV